VRLAKHGVAISTPMRTRDKDGPTLQYERMLWVYTASCHGVRVIHESFSHPCIHRRLAAVGAQPPRAVVTVHGEAKGQETEQSVRHCPANENQFT